MQISIEVDEFNAETLYVSINKSLITTTCAASNGDSLKDWIRDIQKIFPKKIKKTLLVALSAHHSFDYAQGPSINILSGKGKMKFIKLGLKPDAFQADGKSISQKKRPYELLHLFVDRHCLVVHLFKYEAVHKALSYFLCSNRVIVVGVGIEKVAAKLEKDYGIMIGKRHDLRGLAEVDKSLLDMDLSRKSAAEMAKVVLGEEMSYEKPNRMKWYRDGEGYYWPYLLSDELVKHVTVEGFLVHQMGTKYLKDFYSL